MLPYNPQMATISYGGYHVDLVGRLQSVLSTQIPEHDVYLRLIGGPAPQSLLIERNCREVLQPA